MSALGLEEQILLTDALDGLSEAILHGSLREEQGALKVIGEIAGTDAAEFELCVTYFLGRIGADLRELAAILSNASGRPASEILAYAGGQTRRFLTISHLIRVAVASAESDAEAVAGVVREYMTDRGGAERAVFLAELLGVFVSVHRRVCGGGR